MAKLVLCCGISASGKSTYAKELVDDKDYKEINRDYWRFRFFTEGCEDWSKYKFTKAREHQVSCFCLQDWEMAVSNNRNVVVSDTNLAKEYHKLWADRAKASGYDFEVKYFPITLEEAWKRDATRGKLSVGREVIIKQWKKWLILNNYPTYTPNWREARAIIVDIDGTIATHPQRGHHDYDKVGSDTPRIDIMAMVCAWAEREDLQIIIMSGRPDSCREETLKWLYHYMDEVPYLFMRKTGDIRNDRIVKEELFWDNVADQWNVVAAVDDRPRVVRLWHDIGIPNVLSVQNGYDEF
jgi:predicted kinase